MLDKEVIDLTCDFDSSDFEEANYAAEEIVTPSDSDSEETSPPNQQPMPTYEQFQLRFKDSKKEDLKDDCHNCGVAINSSDSKANLFKKLYDGLNSAQSIASDSDYLISIDIFDRSVTFYIYRIKQG